MGKLIAVEGCTLELTIGSGSIEITTDPKDNANIDGNKPYAGSIDIKVSDYNGGTITNSDGEGSASLSPSARHCSLDGDNFVLEGDSVSVTINGTTTDPTSGQKVPQTVTDTVKISKAGQTTTTAD